MALRAVGFTAVAFLAFDAVGLTTVAFLALGTILLRAGGRGRTFLLRSTTQAEDQSESDGDDDEQTHGNLHGGNKDSRDAATVCR